MPDPPATSSRPQGANSFLAILLGVGLILLPIFLFRAVDGIWVWPLGQEFDAVQAERRLMLVVVLSGALGSFIHAATSFADYMGNQRFYASWFWWYLLRPFIGGTLALIFYFAVRGGLLTTNVEAGDISVYGIAALAGLVGMFSKQATDKLSEVFDTLFRTERAAERKDRLRNPAPMIKGVDPPTVPVGEPKVVTIRGEGFIADSVVRIDGKERKPLELEDERITLELEAEVLAEPGSHTISVMNPAPGGGESKESLVVEESSEGEPS